MRVHLESYGCSTNLADGEVLAGCLGQAGYELTDSVHDADVLIYNCCSVKGPTENRMIDLIKRAPKNKKIVVAGCLPLTNYTRLQESARFDAVIGPAAGTRIVDVVNRVVEGEKIVAITNALHTKPLLNLPRLRQNSIVSIIPISYGCLGACAYCCVVFARGRLRSYPIKDIVQKVESDLASGLKEFWLTSQDVGCYGRDLDTNLVELLNAVCAIPGNFRVRVGMMIPNLVLDMLPKLIEAFNNDKVYKFLHLPVQSGDDGVLRSMNRCYTVGEFRTIVKDFRTVFPEITFATDVICGFPGESIEAFENTLRLIDDIRPDIVNVSKFFARPRTEAASITKNIVSQTEIKQRTTVASNLAKKLSLKQNQRWLNWEGTILVNEKGKITNSWVGRNYAYKPIVVKDSDNLFGRTLRVRIEKAFNTYLNGTIIKEPF